MSYDAQKGTFTVTLYEEKAGKPEKVQVEVTQAEIEENIKRSGGSTLGNSGKKTPVWPAVMEAAFAKMHDSNHADGLKEGYDCDRGWLVAASDVRVDRREWHRYPPCRSQNHRH